MFCVAAGDIGRRVREARKAYGDGNMRIADLARRLDLDHGRVSNWERGQHDPPYDMILRIADALDVSVDWLMGEPVPMRDPASSRMKPIARAGTRWIPVFGGIAAGSPTSNTGEAVDWYEMRDWGGDFERWGRVVDGFSMEPFLEAGDMAIFENRQWEPGHIVHAYNDGEDTVKQIRRIEGRLTLCPTNPEYEPIDAESWHVKGVCIAYVRHEDDGGMTLREYKNGYRPKIL